ncbi:LIM domain-containing protein [Loa loa]|uniref:LIM domain-containing protein n=1 Tax=Loa loa TaxID=7209 RepID=A0A1S0UJD1_LOALO|nr:LIM domain-containing protein [Loa loa]EJD74924.1 LIM domain-containing protein [Loa loa]
MTEMEDDPYAISSDTDTESLKGPPPKISIEGRSVADISSLKAALRETKEALKDEKRLEELNQLKEKSEIHKIKRDFIEGRKKELGNEAKPIDEEREQLAAVTKEKYSKFRNKFENLPEVMKEDLEERLKTMAKELTGVGKENLENIKDAFENPQEGNKSEREQIFIERSEADKRRVMRTFTQADLIADDAPKECALCLKTVYPVERIFANKRNYHIQCFKCVKCGKKLMSTNYNMHEEQLVCKLHYLEIFHPEIAKTMDPATREEDEKMEDEEDEEYAISSKPKQLGDDVIKSGTKLDDLSTIGSLKARKGDWENSAKEAEAVLTEKKNIVEEIISGKVKANLEKFVMGAANDEEEEEDEEKDGRDPNIAREDKKHRKEELNFERVDHIKNKWKAGNIQTADFKEMKNDLKELQNYPGVKKRFQEMTGVEQKVAKHWDSRELNTSGVADARRSFLEGSAFQSGPIEKTAIELEELEFKKLQDFKERFEKGEGNIQVQKIEIDIHAGDLNGIKSAFEKGEDNLEITPEERAELKKKQIEEEFLRYKLVRRAAAQREAIKEVSDDVGIEAGVEIQVEEIKNRFEKGDYSSRNEHEDKQLDVEIKMAGKARQKFRQIDAEGTQTIAPRNQQEKHISKWDKKESTIPEPVNRRMVEDEEKEIEDDDVYDVKNLMQKFTNIGREEETKIKHERPSDLDEIKIAARNLKEQFEKVGTKFENETAEEKRRQLEEEFERLRREKEAAAVREEISEEGKFPEKEEIRVAADHASKMAAKWEKIQKKEAKKAEKSRMPPKNATQTVSLITFR